MGASFHSAGRLRRRGALHDPASGLAARWITGAALVALAAAAVPVVLAGQERAKAADDLTQQVLVGPRNLTCQRVVILLDESGSMTQYAQVRTDALATLGAWAPKNLRDDDQVAVVRWAARSETDLPETAVGSLSPSELTPGTSDLGPETENVLLAAQQVEAMPATSCRTALVFVSDGELTTEVNPAELNHVLTDIGADKVSLVLPTAGDAPEYWRHLFPYSETFHADPNDAHQTTRAVGQAIAAATGQVLEVER